ncbi:hypothetical protein CXG81DRAFT_10520 [Caulochytrium protostelioides]|uniref:Phospholipid-transporting ATPase n=1 Tax=Caulochytrium protostelioides TaxID=1555241 RepID=A0A4P9XB92_9FUNG|nr:hypothetical protein CXG81DRAFT_10520 [Caulochytrium protostelioides]|eukprot:RKP02642.1 hypothetical protein CXG81DRAFT_10520 [Caulochytrium protostelioides]
MWGHDDSADRSDRLVYLNDSIKNKEFRFLHNRVSTTKYNFATFLPKFFWEQFSKYANLFFLFTACIQQINGGAISPTNRFNTVIPLSVVIAVSAFKEILEDTKRAKQDAELNARRAKVHNGVEFSDKRWSQIEVGDIVRVENAEFFPADLILLSSSEPDGLCYIETSNLDGETNLKIKQGLPETVGILTPDQAGALEGVIKSELPNNSLYTYEGTLRLGPKEVPLCPDQLLLRGAQLRNTRWVYGLVVFTGHETKLMRNATAAPIKRTKLELMVNRQIIFLFLILVAMALTCASGTYVRSKHSPFERFVLNPLSDASQSDAFILNFLTFVILYNNLIPLSLIVGMEMVKFALGALINSDLDMYHEATDTPATARTSSLVEELGQIDFIFSDKTGTLTCNMMEYRMCTINGVAYADLVPEDKRLRVNDEGKTVGWYEFKRLTDQVAAYRSGAAQTPAEHQQGQFLDEFLTLLAVCHTVIPEMNEETGDVVFQASSPDEGALVKGAQVLGYLFTTRKPKSVAISVGGEELEFQVLNICEFNSTRKRMSSLIRCADGTIKLYVKGADTVILERLAPGQDQRVAATTTHLEEYANEGLRTLCIAMREVSQEEYTEWSKLYEKAATTVNNRGEELDKVAELIEKDLTLLGATAIEDKLQDGVPDTIHTLAQAGIKIWVLTGDRQETAINIGYSCKLLTEEMSLIVVNETTHFETKEFLEKKLMARTIPEIEPIALVIDGKTLSYALEDDVRMTFLELAVLCKAVLCCRVSPLQKALVVKLVRKNVSDVVTLAIGDGANDVSMIQAAHVGIGISGMEGLQAARAADFAIAQFRFLRKLLLVHGGWAYARMSKLIVYSFYKNITLYMTQLWFAIDNGWSGQTLFETWTGSLYNIMFAVMQPIVLGIFDQYVSARMLDNYPQMYKIGQDGGFYSHRIFWSWIANSFLHSVIIYYISRGIFGEADNLASGSASSIWIFGEMTYTIVLLTITCKAALTASTWVLWTHVAIFGSIALWIVFFPVYAIVAPYLSLSTELYGIVPPLYGGGSFWFAVILVPIMANFRDLSWKYWKRQHHSDSYHIVQEIQKYHIPDYRPRMEWFRKAVHKNRIIQRLKRNRGFAFSQNEGGQADLIRVYDTTRRKPKG